MTRPRIGLALSGGGFRATCFGLGCLRALEDHGLLDEVRVVSGISGGSLLAGMWAYGPDRFDEFDESVTTLLREGLQAELVRRALSPRFLLRSGLGTAGSVASPRRQLAHSFNRTHALIEALAARSFGARLLSEVTRDQLSTIISATDVRTSNAVRFGSANSSCSPYGRILDPITVAEAVAASAAFPLLLPTISRTYTFENRLGETSRRSVTMTDGGIYDNLGVSPLLPGRSTAHTAHVYDLDYLIVADAGRGIAVRKPGRFLLSRMTASFEVTHRKNQDAARAQLHALRADNRIAAFVHTYLGMKDDNLPIRPHDLVRRSEVASYPTNFAAMKESSISDVASRAEQLTGVLLAAHAPEL